MVEAVVTFDYEAVQDDELSLKEGQIITNITLMEEGWWEGEVNGQRGLFPDNFVEVLKKEKPVPVKGKAPSPPPAAPPSAVLAAPLAVPDAAHATVNGDSQDVSRREGSEKTKKLRAKVVFSYHPQNEDEIGLTVNDVIDVVGQPEDGWWEGVVKGKKGLFPSNFVSLEEGAESADMMDGAVPKDEPPPIPTEPPRPRPPKVRGVGFGNIFAGGEVKLRRTPGNSSADNPKRAQTQSVGPSELAQKRSVSNAKEEPKKELKTNVRREDKKEDEEFEEMIKERAKVAFPYEAQHSDELELKDGDIVTVLDKEAGDSGWWLGEVDGRKGVFPDNFVTMLPPEKEKIKKRAPAAMPARPVSVPRPLHADTKPAKPMPSKPPQPHDSSATPNTQPRRPSSNQDAVSAAQNKMEPPARKPHPIAAPKPPKKVLPIPPKKPAPKAKAPPPKPSAPPPDREEAQPTVVLRRKVNDTKEPTEGSFEDLKPESGQKLTHITLSRPKNANRRPPSVFSGQSNNLSDARDKALQHEENSDSPDGRVLTSPTAVTSPTSATNSSQPSWVRELKARSIKRPSPLAMEPQSPVENGTAVPPPRPKSSPIGPMLAATTQAQAQATTTSKGRTETSPAQSPATSRPSSIGFDTAGQAQVEELKKDIKSLQDQMASVRSEFKKDVVNLMSELDDEKKHRMAMQVELDRIKKLVLEKK